jgi:hypothetical protein
MTWVLLDPNGVVQGAHVNDRTFLEPRDRDEWTEANGWRIVEVADDVPVRFFRPLPDPPLARLEGQ